jgi:hypothetical protein
MQPQEQIAVSTTVFGWLGPELLSLMQLFFFLTLGYALTRCYQIWSRSCVLKKAIAKKVDDIDQPLKEKELDEAPQVQAKTTQANAIERKRQRKAKEASKRNTGTKSENTELGQAVPAVVASAPVQVILEEQPLVQPLELSPEEQPKEDPVKEQEAPAPAEQVPEEEPVISERVAKLMAKKQERKARKAVEKKEQEEKVLPEEQSRQVEPPEPPAAAGGHTDVSPTVAIVEAKSDAEALSCDAQTVSAPSMVPTTSDSSPEELEQENTQSNESELQGNKNEVHTIEEVEQENIESNVNELQCNEIEVPIVEEVSTTTTMETAQPEEEEEEHTSKLVTAASLDALETDYVKSEESDENASTPEGICTPEEIMTPRRTDTGSPPLIWCGVDPTENSAMPLGPQIEGWVPVCVPIEHAPPGAFDGIWKNQANERIEINHSEVAFESGERWALQMLSMTSVSLEVGEEEFTAELDPEKLTLRWSDGDVWTCVDQTENQKQWAAASNNPDADSPVPGLLWEGALMTGEQFFVEATPPPLPEDAQDWEICWDWSKKGWCTRANCEWYHPGRPSMPAVPDFCKPCGFNNAAFLDGPFADEQPPAPFSPGSVAF